MTQRVPSGLANSCIDPASFEPSTCDADPPLCEQRAESSSPAPSAPWGLRFCRDADTVVEGFLCDEPVVVSNACRKPNNAFDAYVCDDPRMHALQTRVLEETFALLKGLLLQLFRR
jgi:hypothetical protein